MPARAALRVSMPRIDSATARYYQLHAGEVAGRYESVASPLTAQFSLAFPPGSRVLDVGAGSGRDLAALRALGCAAVGIEPVAALRAAALAAHPALAGHLLAGGLPELPTDLDGNFDGVLCSAVLMHVPAADLFDSALALRRVLKPGGRLLLSLPAARSGLSSARRDADGRLFEAYGADFIQLLFERLGFLRVGRWDTADALQRPDTAWYTLLLEWRGGAVVRPIDQIEGILNRDRKEASYKFALMRALAELATQEPHCARWHRPGEVGVPLQRIAEKWLEYYWPIFAAGTVPQSYAEAGGGKPLLFRRPLQALMQPYATLGPHGGLEVWRRELARGLPDGGARSRLQSVLKALRTAIREGPVRHAGGALAAGPVFGFDAAQATVQMPAALWTEFSLLGHWIRDAVILRWAEFSARLGTGLSLTAGDLLPLLLAPVEATRDVSLAAAVFAPLVPPRCVWSDRPLPDGYHIDHVIPFSLWGCNDLWNLLPVHPRVNLAKGDKLPAADLLRARQPVVVDCWGQLREALPLAFDTHARHLLGEPLPVLGNWQGVLFGRLREAVEVTALQRGVERWQPSSRPSP